MDINVWTSSTIEKFERKQDGDGWSVIVRKADGTSRILKPRYLILALGLAGAPPNMPSHPGMVRFNA